MLELYIDEVQRQILIKLIKGKPLVPAELRELAPIQKKLEETYETT